MKNVICVIALFFSALAFAREFYTQTVESEGKKKAERVELIRSVADGKERVEYVTETGSQVVILDASGQVSREEGKDADGAYLIERNGDSLRVTGAVKGKAIDRTIKLEGRPYYGTGFSWSSRALIASGKKSLKFWMFSEFSEDKPIEMELKMQDAEEVNDVEGYRIRIGLTGLLAPFWSATEWVASDGRMLRYVGNTGPGTADTVVNCVY